MKTAFAAVGAFHLLMFVLGMFGVLDYHLCLRGAGECQIVVVKK